MYMNDESLLAFFCS